MDGLFVYEDEPNQVEPFRLDKISDFCPVLAEYWTNLRLFVQCWLHTGQIFKAVSSLIKTLDNIDEFCPVLITNHSLFSPFRLGEMFLLTLKEKSLRDFNRKH